ncbi:MAG TPA: ABC-F family ATP-binding cassette domain-containing protein [Bryobacteraceae bacterium]|nr:ABC-F family ATP-binding cassette domain-containing protein [Bryobacteraceae bacterium]
MPLLISCQNIHKSFGARPLFDNLSLNISDGERIGLIGPNGAGKSTLMQILAGEQKPDDGTVSVRKLVRLSYVPQEAAFGEQDTARSVVAGARMAIRDEGERTAYVGVTLGKAGFSDFDAKAVSLSGGWRKRLSIARALAEQPDLLLLDEPTNHLDLEGILWLEKLLKTSSFASVVVSHDRYFLENVVSDMVEINRVYPDGLFRVKGNYSEFLMRREESLAAQSKHQEALENRVNREVEWLRRGAKARTSKSKARIDAAGRLIEELADVNARTVRATTQIDFTASERKTKKLLVAASVCKQLGGKRLFQNLRTTLSPGVRLGLVGPNGSGKTTLLRLLTGELQPDSGTIERADNLRVVYFDQNRETLDPELPLRKALCPHGDSVIYRDRPTHVVSWAKRFLFRTEQLDLAVGRLSGGEKARVHIARLMLEPADLLLLDEPTNDLDIPTLEVLEESLLEFTGALVLVTHDRFMLDRVSTIVLGLDGQGGAENFADYSQWEQSLSQRQQKPVRTEALVVEKERPSAKKRLSYMESREWKQMEDLIAAAEAHLAACERDMQDPIYASDPRKLHENYEKLQSAQAEVSRLYERWAELEAKQG